jgi:hypothetical protein
MPDTKGAISLAKFMGHAEARTPAPWTQEEIDAATRASDLINEARASEPWDLLKHCFIAIRLSDGGCDMVLYESKKDAIRYQVHEQQCAYIAFRSLAGGASPSDMLRILRFHRGAYRAGMRLVDPDDRFGGPDIAPTTTLVDMVGNIVRPHL